MNKNPTFLIVYAHPDPTSYCEALKNKAISYLKSKNYDYFISDLYKMNFNPVISRSDYPSIPVSEPFKIEDFQKRSSDISSFSPNLLEELNKIEKADNIIFISPMYWGTIPAILKGWFDRCFIRGKSWDYNYWYETGLLKGKKALIVMTVGAIEEDFEKNGKMQMKFDEIIHHVKRALEFCGLEVLPNFPVFCGGKNKEMLENILEDFYSSLNKFI